jgi:hypothetical protein
MAGLDGGIDGAAAPSQRCRNLSIKSDIYTMFFAALPLRGRSATVG